MSRKFYVYVMTNPNNKVLYTGVTNNLKLRVNQHKEKMVDGFTKRYNVNKLVYYELLEEPQYAIMREKQIKGGSRKRKINLINKINKNWDDLYEEL